MEGTQDPNSHFRALERLGEALRALHAEVLRHDFDAETFGSWSLVLRVHGVRMRLAYDGRDRTCSLARAAFDQRSETWCASSWQVLLADDAPMPIEAIVRAVGEAASAPPTGEATPIAPARFESPRMSMTLVQRVVLTAAVPTLVLVLLWNVHWQGVLRVELLGNREDLRYLDFLREQTWFWAAYIASVAAWVFYLWRAQAGRPQSTSGNRSGDTVPIHGAS